MICCRFYLSVALLLLVAGTLTPSADAAFARRRRQLPSVFSSGRGGGGGGGGLPGVPGPRAGDASPAWAAITNGIISANVSAAMGLVSVFSHFTSSPSDPQDSTIPLSNDVWSVKVGTSLQDPSPQVLSPSTCEPSAIQDASPSSVSVFYRCPGVALYGYTATVVYSVPPGAHFVTKAIKVRSISGAASFFVQEVDVFYRLVVGNSSTSGSSPSPTTPDPVVEARNPYIDASVASFFRFPVLQQSWWLAVQNPFVKDSTDGSVYTATYDPNDAYSAWPGDEDSLYYECDAGMLGVANISKYYIPENGVNFGEAQAWKTAVDSFMLDSSMRASGTVKINIGWDENDYQIDIANETQVEQYKRLILRNSQFGITHMVFAPHNNNQSSIHNNTDVWGWESVLWMTMGEKFRMGEWSPSSDPIPPSVRSILDFAAANNVKLCAYVYPTLGFTASSDWLFTHDGHTFSSLASKRFQNYLFDQLSAFLNITNVGGFAWDYLSFRDQTTGNQYAEWKGWMRVLKRLRAAHPDIVMDHRQQNHMYGVWYQLPGSYAEPLAGDENPETYGVAIANLNTDHVAADFMRSVNYIYRQEQLQPSSRIPGFMFHQSDRYDDHGSLLWTSLNTRDFDYMGYKYSLLSVVATAGLNHVVCMIPARDLEEFTLFPQADVDFVQSWLAWTDLNAKYLERTVVIAGTGPPSPTAVDGTAAFYDDQGYVFFFNPGQIPRTGYFTVDEGVGISNASSTDTWLMTELYPRPGLNVAIVAHGTNVSVDLAGGTARVLSLTKVPSSVSSPILLGFTGVASFDTSTSAVSITGAKLEAGTTVSAFVYGLPSTASVRSVSVDGISFPFAVAGAGIVAFNVTATGSYFPVNGLVGPATPSKCPSQFLRTPPATTSSFCTSFTVPSVVNAQIAARKQSYPVPWRPDEELVSWLDPSRLLMYINTQPPTLSTVNVTIDNAQVPVLMALNSREHHADNTLLGYFVDVSALNLSASAHDVHVTFDPPVNTTSFVGVFWHNVEQILAGPADPKLERMQGYYPDAYPEISSWN